MRNGILSLVGNTPLIELQRLSQRAPGRLYAKLEGFNPSGSIKDRTALALIDAALQRGELRPGSTVIESSSGNLGIGLAQACLYHGLRFVCVVDPKATRQNTDILKAYGAIVDVVAEPDPETGEFLQARLHRVRYLLATTPNSYWPDQYSNLANPKAHHATMREIVDQLGYAPDYLFCAAGTCGTLRGCVEYLRENKLATIVIGVDAVGSVISGDTRKKRLIPGHGAAVVPKLFSADLVSRFVRVTDAECVSGCRRLLQTEAILSGGSAGGVISAFQKASAETPLRGTTVLILSDRGERYLDSVFCDAWVEQHLGSECISHESYHGRHSDQIAELQ